MPKYKVFVLTCILLSLFTQSALSLDYTYCQGDEYPDLSLKMPYVKNSAVDDIQEALSSLGYYHGPIDGTYNNMTAEAVRIFQKTTGLAPDGMVRYHVWLRLAKAYEDKFVVSEKPALPKGHVSIIIDMFRRKLIVFDDDRAYAQFPVAIGKPETPSPIGNWKISSKATNWGTGFGTRWMRLGVPWGIFGIHGTNKPYSIGSLASHGCFRMHNDHVETIFPWVKVGTPVIVIGNPFGYMSGGLKVLGHGSRHSAVLLVQQKLQRLGYYEGVPDGIYGSGTAKAVKNFQTDRGLSPTGQVGTKEYKALGFF